MERTSSLFMAILTAAAISISGRTAAAWDFLAASPSGPANGAPAASVAAVGSVGHSGMRIGTQTDFAAAPSASTTPTSFSSGSAVSGYGGVASAEGASGNAPALATHDGVTVYEAHANGGVRVLGSSASGESALPAIAGTVSRSSDPFNAGDWTYRTENLPVQWIHDGDDFTIYVEYAGFRWVCVDGSISIPEDERPKTISKLDLLLALRELDKTDDFFTWLELSGLKPYWDAAQVMATDHPLFEQGLATVKIALELSDEEVQDVLSRIAK